MPLRHPPKLSAIISSVQPAYRLLKLRHQWLMKISNWLSPSCSLLEALGTLQPIPGRIVYEVVFWLEQNHIVRPCVPYPRQ